MITIDLNSFDPETEVAITRARSGLAVKEAERVVDLVSAFRATGVADFSPSVRSCIMIAKVMVLRLARAETNDPVFEQTCLDVLASGWEHSSQLHQQEPRRRDLVLDLIRQCCPAWSQLE